MSGRREQVKFDATKMLYVSKLVEVLDSEGCPIDDVLRAAGLSRSDLRHRDRQIAMSVYLLAVEAAVRQYDIPDLGFRVGEHTSPLEHGVLGYALLSSPVLRDSLQRYVRFQYLHGPLLSVTFEESGATASLTAVPVRGRWCLSPAALRYVVQEWLIGWNQWCRMIGRSGNFFEHVRLAYAAGSHRRYYEEHLGCTVSFGNPATTAIFSASRLDLPLEYADESIAALCSVQCEALLDILNRRRGLVAEIYRQLTSAPGQVPNMDDMAARLHLGERTLRRRLQLENVTYQEVVREFRVAMASRYLSETSLPANEIAALVGYSDPANLYRTFQKSAGLTPQQFREQRRNKVERPGDHSPPQGRRPVQLH
jgi:AraC-like DNA-binding protein